jgi:3-dehydroquinate dehydratase / shikimate dehydrogenase
VVTIATERLLLRPWRADDRPAFAALNADPLVMEWFPETLTRERSDALAERIERLMEEHGGWGVWAVEVPGVADFIGFVGLNAADETLGRPATEVAWRLAAEHWGHGYAPEAALAALAYGFDTLKRDEIVAIATVGNARSRRVMEKIGMTYDATADFDHPSIPKDSPLRRHVLYRLSRDAFVLEPTGAALRPQPPSQKW